MDFRTYDLDSYEFHEDERGYVRIYVGEGEHPHDNKGMVLVHRLVMEAHLGRWLETNEVVHHINEVKTDNRLHNLFLCSPEEHVAIHNRGRVNSLQKRNNIRKGVQAAQARNQKTERQSGKP